jgi:hypothetical protein
MDIEFGFNKKEQNRIRSAGKYLGLNAKESQTLTQFFTKRNETRRKNKQARISRKRNRK